MAMMTMMTMMVAMADEDDDDDDDGGDEDDDDDTSADTQLRERLMCNLRAWGRSQGGTHYTECNS